MMLKLHCWLQWVSGRLLPLTTALLERASCKGVPLPVLSKRAAPEKEDAPGCGSSRLPCSLVSWCGS